MKLITDTFVLVAADCPARVATVPAARGSKPTVAAIQHELLAGRPYELTLEDLMFETFLRRSGTSEAEASSRAPEIRGELFSKPYPCKRASPLPKTYGWGVHHDRAGKIALFGVDSEEYRRFSSGTVEGVSIVAALRKSRAG